MQKRKRKSVVTPETVQNQPLQKKKKSKVKTAPKKQNKKKKKKEKDENFSTVKIPLRTILKAEHADAIIEIISDHSKKATKIASLASLLLLGKLNDKLNDHAFFRENDPAEIVKDSFFEVLDQDKTQSGKRRIPKFPPSSSFRQAMTNNNITRPDNNYMGNMFKYLHQLYATSFETNITTHGFRRVQKFFKSIDGPNKDDIKNTIDYLFNSDSDRTPNAQLIAELQQLDNRYGNWSVGALQDFEDNWFEYVPLFIKIQRRIHLYNMRNQQEWLQEDEQHKKSKTKTKLKRKHPKIRPMNIIPIFKYRRQHLRIDNDGLFRIVTQLKQLPKRSITSGMNIDFPEFVKRKDEFWNKYFDMEKIETIRYKNKQKLKFHYHIQTDGVSVTLLYDTLPSEEKSNDRLDRIKRKFENKEYRNVTSIDVGYNTYLATVRKDTKTDIEYNFTLKSKSYHRSTQMNCRKKHAEIIVGEYERDAAHDRESQPEMPSPTAIDVWPYIRHRLKFLERGIAVYTKREYASLAFWKYHAIQQRTDTITRRLTNNCPTLLLIGGAEFSANSPIKGHIRCPGIRKITKAINKYKNCDYVFVDEYKTSQLCGICLTPFVGPKSARFKTCIHCPKAEHIIKKATAIVSKKPKRLMQKERREGQQTPKYMYYVPDPANVKKTTWQRDISACRLIAYKGEIDIIMKSSTNLLFF